MFSKFFEFVHLHLSKQPEKSFACHID
jgi:hypothetical protein